MIRKSLIRGTGYSPQLTITDKATGLALSSFDGYTCQWGLKEAVNSTDYAVDPVDGTCAADGTCVAEVTAADTEALTPQEYVAEWVVSLAGEPKIRYQYSLTLIQNVIPIPVTP